MSDRTIVAISGIGLLSCWLGYFATLWSIGWPIEVNAAHVSGIVTAAVLAVYGLRGQPANRMPASPAEAADGGGDDDGAPRKMDDRTLVAISGIGLLSFWLGYFAALWSIGWPIDLNAAHLSGIGMAAMLTSYGLTGRPSFD